MFTSKLIGNKTETFLKIVKIEKEILMFDLMNLKDLSYPYLVLKTGFLLKDGGNRKRDFKIGVIEF